MITIKTGNYSEEEVKLLAELFERMGMSLIDAHCNNGRCVICPYRHICDAIHSATEFLNRK